MKMHILETNASHYTIDKLLLAVNEIQVYYIQL